MTNGGSDEYTRYDSAKLMDSPSSQRRHERYVLGTSLIEAAEVYKNIHCKLERN